MRRAEDGTSSAIAFALAGVLFIGAISTVLVYTNDRIPPPAKSQPHEESTAEARQLVQTFVLAQGNQAWTPGWTTSAGWTAPTDGTGTLQPGLRCGPPTCGAGAYKLDRQKIHQLALASATVDPAADTDGDTEPNASDADLDGDGLGNADDPDIDGDGLCNGGVATDRTGAEANPATNTPCSSVTESSYEYEELRDLLGMTDNGRSFHLVISYVSNETVLLDYGDAPPQRVANRPATSYLTLDDNVAVRVVVQVFLDSP